MNDIGKIVLGFIAALSIGWFFYNVNEAKQSARGVNTKAEVVELNDYEDVEDAKPAEKSSINVEHLGNRLHQFFKSKRVGIISRFKIESKDNSPLALVEITDRWEDGSASTMKRIKETRFRVEAQGYKCVRSVRISAVGVDGSSSPDLIQSRLMLSREKAYSVLYQKNVAGYYTLACWPEGIDEEGNLTEPVPGKSITIDFYLMPIN